MSSLDTVSPSGAFSLDLVVIDCPNGRRAVAFQRIADWVAPTWPGGTHPQQFRLDLCVPDLDEAEPVV